MAAIFTKPVILFEVFKINTNGNDAVETQKRLKAHGMLILGSFNLCLVRWIRVK